MEDKKRKKEDKKKKESTQKVGQVIIFFLRVFIFYGWQMRASNIIGCSQRKLCITEHYLNQ